MSCSDFRGKVRELIVRAGREITVTFYEEDGKFVADCSEGTRITCNRINPSVSVRWGDHHQAMAII